MDYSYYSPPSIKTSNIPYADNPLSTRFGNGLASQVIEPYNIFPGDRTLDLARVSTYHQDKNLDAQAVNLAYYVNRSGGKVAHTCRQIHSARDDEWYEVCLPGIASIAKHMEATILLAATPDRFSRSGYFIPGDKLWGDRQAQDHDLDRLRMVTERLRLMTYIHPDSTPAACRSLLIRWGRTIKGKSGGRPRKSPVVDKRAEFGRYVEILRKQGLSFDQISRQIENETDIRIPPRTIWYWNVGSRRKEKVELEEYW